MKEFPAVVPVKLVRAFTRRREGEERESIISVIPDVSYRESILVF